ncbi:hypothetical protein GGS23DRAFT_413132 [Durotheca rogersii]|uniref:uncharacterized protein n=1 Tax=Durotheca rogersii TaxID=419775 RepID=UPI00221FFDE3|nr:uncharacterized protein GGS23DRAFT_413132 [Durotheca rogersii]KAI5865181.1 hypothetical protein GGS23DRAFT_413132 [Durotheca rogersii]
MMTVADALPAFPQFGALAPELRDIIWAYALPDDTPEVCIPWPLEEFPASSRENDDGGGFAAPWPEPLDPLLVDTGFPALMHTCRESRAVAEARTRLRWSPLARCATPFRAYRPDLDELYMSVPRGTVGGRATIPRWSMFPKGARHVACDLHSLRDGSFFWILLAHPLMDVETLTCVLPAPPGAVVDTTTRFRPPTRRCRLRWLETQPRRHEQQPQPQQQYGEYEEEEPIADAESYIILVNQRMTGLRSYLEEVRDHSAAEFAEILHVAAMPAEYMRRWDAATSRFKIKFLAAAFEEYRGGRWVPSCDHALRFETRDGGGGDASSRGAGTYRVSEAEKWTPLRDPERFRVNDIQQDEVPLWDEDEEMRDAA